MQRYRLLVAKTELRPHWQLAADPPRPSPPLPVPTHAQSRPANHASTPRQAAQGVCVLLPSHMACARSFCYDLAHLLEPPSTRRGGQGPAMLSHELASLDGSMGRLAPPASLLCLPSRSTALKPSNPSHTACTSISRFIPYTSYGPLCRRHGLLCTHHACSGTMRKSYRSVVILKTRIVSAPRTSRDK